MNFSFFTQYLRLLKMGVKAGRNRKTKIIVHRITLKFSWMLLKEISIKLLSIWFQFEESHGLIFKSWLEVLLDFIFMHLFAMAVYERISTLFSGLLPMFPAVLGLFGSSIRWFSSVPSKLNILFDETDRLFFLLIGKAFAFSSFTDNLR